MSQRASLLRRALSSALAVGLLTVAALGWRNMPGRARAQLQSETPSAVLGPRSTGATSPPLSGEPTDEAAGVSQLIATATRTPTPINIGNFVWDDLDQDGRQDAGEPGLAGVTVQLWNSAKTQLIDQTVTSPTGSYTVVAPLPGDYRIRVVLPSAQDSFSPQDQAGGDDQKDSDISPAGGNLGFTAIFTLASNVISTTIYDAGIIVFRPPTPTRTPTPINIGNFVWVDLNANGIQEAGEPGLGGVTVQLWNPERTQLIDQALTSPTGSYTVVAPLPGDYRIRVVLPPGASFAPKDAGADDQKDSDINRLLIVNTFGFSDVFTLASNVISTTIYDAGLINVPATATPTNTPATTPTNTPTTTPTSAPTSVGSAGLPVRAYLPAVRR